MSLRPDIALPRIDPGATHLERDAIEAIRFEPGAATEPIPRLQNQHRLALPPQFPRRRQAGEATPNDERVVNFLLTPLTRSHTRIFLFLFIFAVSDRISRQSA